jgi:hypothetical protein
MTDYKFSINCPFCNFNNSGWVSVDKKDLDRHGSIIVEEIVTFCTKCCGYIVSSILVAPKRVLTERGFRDIMSAKPFALKGHR